MLSQTLSKSRVTPVVIEADQVLKRFHKYYRRGVYINVVSIK